MTVDLNQLNRAVAIDSYLAQYMKHLRKQAFDQLFAVGEFDQFRELRIGELLQRDRKKYETLSNEQLMTTDERERLRDDRILQMFLEEQFTLTKMSDEHLDEYLAAKHETETFKGCNSDKAQ